MTIKLEDLKPGDVLVRNRGLIIYSEHNSNMPPHNIGCLLFVPAKSSLHTQVYTEHREDEMRSALESKDTTYVGNMSEALLQFATNIKESYLKE